MGLSAKSSMMKQIDARKLLQLALVAADSPRGVQARGELALTGEEHVAALAERAMAERLREVALAGTERTDDEHRRLLVEIAAGGEIADQAAVDAGQAIEVERIERLLRAEARAAQARAELLLLAPRDFVLDQEREELRVGELAVDDLAVARIKRIEDTGQAQQLERRGERVHRIHE